MQILNEIEDTKAFLDFAEAMTCIQLAMIVDRYCDIHEGVLTQSVSDRLLTGRCRREG